MWHTIKITTGSASRRLDVLIELVNWMMETGKGSRLSISDNYGRSMTISFWDEGEFSAEDWRQWLADVFDGCEYEIE